MTKPSRCRGCPLYDNCMTQPAAGQDTEVLFLATSPKSRGAFREYGGSLVRGILSASEDPLVINMKPKVGFTYITWCKLGEDENLKKSHIETCRDLVSMSWLEKVKPKVILAFGGQDISTFFKSSSKKKGDMRGSVYIHRWKTGGTCDVVYTISLDWLAAKPGLAGLVSKDISAAARHLYQKDTKKATLPQLAKLYDTPTGLQDVRDSVDEFVAWSGPNGIPQTLMSLDTETNTLFPWWDKARIISISAAMSKTKALSFAVDHRDASYDLADIAPWVVKLTMSGHPKAWWNYKYDLGMFGVSFKRQLMKIMTPGLSKDIERVSGHSWSAILSESFIHNTRWDGQLGEHLLEEDKSGFYSLKDVVLDYLPRLHGYEDALKTKLADLTAERLAAVEETLDEMTLQDLGVRSTVLPLDTVAMDINSGIKNARNRIKTAIRGYKAQGRTASVSAYEKKLLDLNTAFAALRREIAVGKKAAKEESFITSPKVAGEPSLWTYEDVPLDMLLLYGAIDAAATVHISKEQRIRLHSQSLEHCKGIKPIISLMDRHCLPLSRLFADIQSEGVYVDKEYTLALSEEMGTGIEGLESKIKSILEEDFPGMGTSDMNFRSDRDLANILVGWYGLPVLEQTSNGQASMKGEHLAKYRDDHGSEIAGLLIDYSTLNKAKSDFVDKFLYLSSYDNKLHGEYRLHGTATGRASGRSPNLTNVPERVSALGKSYIVKKCIVATPIHRESWWDSRENQGTAVRYGWTKEDSLVVVDADLSGAEIRILTRYAQDPGLIQAIKDGLDVHSWITSEVHGLPYEDIQTYRKEDSDRGRKYSDLRDGTKGVVFKIIYGGTPEDRNLMDMIFNRFPAIPRYMADTKNAIRGKEILVTPNGRPRRFPLVRMSNKIERRNYRQGINFNVQSYCSDIVMSVLYNIYTHLSEVRGRLMLTVHDSIVFEVPSSEAANINGFLDKHITQHIAEEFPDIPVPMTYGFKVGKNYGEMSKL